MRKSVAMALVLCACAVPSPARLFSRSGGGDSKITLRKRLHVNTLITEPGTAEIDWSSLYSFSTSNFAMPSAIRYTPEGTNVIWGRTEYSIAFDSVTSANIAGTRLNQFSQGVTLAATSVIHDGEKFDVAIAPQATFFLRDEQGARLGAVAIARYDSGRNSTGVTFSWSGATHASATNPTGTIDIGFGYGRQLSGRAWLEKFTPHMNIEWERSTGATAAVLALEGVEYQITERFALDVSGQHFKGRNSADNQMAVGITYNIGHAH